MRCASSRSAWCRACRFAWPMSRASRTGRRGIASPTGSGIRSWPLTEARGAAGGVELGRGGPSLDQLAGVAAQVVAAADGPELWAAGVDAARPAEARVMTPDRARLAELGLDAAAVARTLQALGGGARV